MTTWRRLACAMLLVLPAPAVAQVVPDSLVVRVQQLVNAGNRLAAHALADSALLIRTVGTAAYAEALYARALSIADAASAERDYLRVAIEYPLSARAESAMMMAGQLKMSRGDRSGARAQFERLVLEFPASTQVARASYWAGRLALEDGDLATGCQSLFVASERARRDDVEFRNQIDYLRTRCMMPAAPATAPLDTTATQDSASGRSATPGSTQGAITSTEWSVQVAAFQGKQGADALSNRLKTRGFQVRVVRVVGARLPYRVRVGRYPTREEAIAAQGRMKRSKVDGIVVQAEAR